MMERRQSAGCSRGKGRFGLEEMILEHGYAVFTPDGKSMLPLFRPGQDTVVIRKRQEYKQYDIVLYRRENGEFILHRMIGQDEQGYILCGDGQCQKEYKVSENQILGSVQEWSRSGKVKKPQGFRYRLYVLLWCRCFFLRRVCFLSWSCFRKTMTIFGKNW